MKWKTTPLYHNIRPSRDFKSQWKPAQQKGKDWPYVYVYVLEKHG